MNGTAAIVVNDDERLARRRVEAAEQRHVEDSSSQVDIAADFELIGVVSAEPNIELRMGMEDYIAGMEHARLLVTGCEPAVCQDGDIAGRAVTPELRVRLHNGGRQDGAVDLQGARADGRGAGVAIGSAEDEPARPILVKPPSPAIASAPVIVSLPFETSKTVLTFPLRNMTEPCA